MLQEFTKDDQLREQYRLHEEWLREQRYYERLMKKQQEELLKEKSLREKAEKQSKLLENELKKNQKRSVLAMKESGISDKKIAEILRMSEDDVKGIS